MKPLEMGSQEVIKGSGFVNSTDPSFVEVGSNTSTVALRIVGGDKREVSNLKQ
jgi:hypothetical protein